jgi:hypothetical protein
MITIFKEQTLLAEPHDMVVRLKAFPADLLLHSHRASTSIRFKTYELQADRWAEHLEIKANFSDAFSQSSSSFTCFSLEAVDHYYIQLGCLTAMNSPQRFNGCPGFVDAMCCYVI